MRSMIVATHVMILFIVTTPTPHACVAAEDLGRELEVIRASHKIPGMAIVVLHEDKTIATGVAGVRQRSEFPTEKETASKKIALGDQFHIGSCTKAMTATLIALLVKEKKLRWQTTLAEALPDVTLHKDYRAVTLDMLLCNHGGCPANISDTLWAAAWADQSDPVAARRRLAEGILATAPTQVPGKEYAYSNAGFAIAGHIAETVMETPFEALLQEKLFAPLGITGAGFGAPGDGQPRGHRSNGSVVLPGIAADNPVAMSPAGRVHLPLLDWARFVQLHLSVARKEPSPLLPQAALEQLHRRFRPDHNYARAWSRVKRSWAGGHALTHSGSNTYWYAVAWLAPQRDFAVIICANQGGDAAARACDAAAGLGIALLQKSAQK